MNIFHKFLETKISDSSHAPTNVTVTQVVKMNLRQALITASLSWRLGELQACFPLACIALKEPAGSQTFVQAQTVMTETINVVMSVWHPKYYFLQGLSHISENIGSKQNSALSLSIPKLLALENLIH